MAKNLTKKKDKKTYRPWRKINNFCKACGRGLDIVEENFCGVCVEKIKGGYDIW